VRVCPTAGSWVDSGVFIEFVTFGINDTFRQAFTVPNIYFSGMVGNESVGGIASIAIHISGSDAGNRPWIYQSLQGQGYPLHDAAVGATGTNEGHVTARLMVSNLNYGSCVNIYRGSLYTTPLHS
jgi:hypothetical protein